MTLSVHLICLHQSSPWCSASCGFVSDKWSLFAQWLYDLQRLHYVRKGLCRSK